MRNQQELFGAFDSVGSDTVDADEMLARVHAGSAARQIAHRRRVSVLSVAAAAALIVIGATLIPALGNDGSDRGQVATTPTPSTQPRSVALRPAELAFTLRDRPAGYPGERAQTMSAGVQELTFYTYEGSGDPLTLSIRLFDPARAAIAVPVPTAESATVDSVSDGPLTVSFIETEEIEGAISPSTAVGWQIGSVWLTITSNAQGNQARQDVLDAAALVDIGGVDPFTFPFQIGYVPAGYNITSASRQHDPDGHVASYLGFDNGPQLGFGSEMAVSADTLFSVPDGVVPNTTVGNYEAAFSPGTVESGPHLYIFDVDGFTIGIQGSLANTEAELRQMGVTIRVIPGAAGDPSVWTEQPIG